MVRAIGCLVGILLASSVMAEEAEIMFILDASGSMRAADESGRPKIEEAKQVIYNAVSGLPSGVTASLATFGHRRTGDCTDLEIKIPPGTKDRDRFFRELEGITPQFNGRTPLAATIKEVGKALRTYEGVGVIVVISDGHDTCEGDPCSQTKFLLQTKNFGFKLHAVGYTVDDKQKEQLECMAKVGGGKYFGADSARELEEIVEKQITLGRVMVQKPSNIKVKGWELIADGEAFASIAVRGGVSSQGMLWAEFPVPFGYYTIKLYIDGGSSAIERRIFVEGGRITKVKL